MTKQSDLIYAAPLLAAALNNANDAFIVARSDGQVMLWSEKAESLFGWTAGEAIGSTLTELIVPPKLRARHDAGMSRYLATGEGQIVGKRIRIGALHKGGYEMPIELTVNPFVIDEAIYFCASIRDNLSQLLYESSLKQQAALLDLSRDSITVCDLEHRIQFWNAGASRMFGYTGDEALDRIDHALLRSVYPKPIAQIMADALLTLSWEGEVLHYRRDGEPITVFSRWAIETDTHGEATRVLISSTDITAKKKYEEHIEYLATHDALTGLPNRRLLETRMQRALLQAEHHLSTVTTLFIDLNRFKLVNDSLGHPAGDQLLVAVAQRLRSVVGSDDIVARLGGDEFIVCVTGDSRSEPLEQMVERLHRVLSIPLILAGRNVVVTASIGASLYPRDGIDAGALLHAADLAMYHARRAGPGGFSRYCEEMNTHRYQRLITENALRTAVEREEFVVHYQPRVDAGSGKLMTVEALVRWQHPQRGLLMPAEFIQIAEEIDLIGPLGAIVLRTACADLKTWQRLDLQCFGVSVNLSPRQLASPVIQSTVCDALRRANLKPSFLELEVTESGLMQNIETAERILSQIRSTGVRISIDDFGTGYSSLSWLKKLPIDTIKIDRSFIADVCDDEHSAAIVTATIAMAHTMNLNVVAEGVETQQQVACLLRMGCDQFQGYLFSRPLTAPDLVAALREGRWA